MDSTEDVSICSGGDNVEEDNNNNDTTEVGFIALEILIFKLQPSFQVIFKSKIREMFLSIKELFFFLHVFLSI